MKQLIYLIATRLFRDLFRQLKLYCLVFVAFIFNGKNAREASNFLSLDPVFAPNDIYFQFHDKLIMNIIICVKHRSLGQAT